MMRGFVLTVGFFLLGAGAIWGEVASPPKDCLQDGNKPECAYEALYVGKFKPKIDGKLNDMAWRFAPGVFLGKDFWEPLGEDYNGESDLSATWWVVWDEDNLYVAVEVTDDKHQNTKSGAQIYAGDGIQFTIDPTGEKKVHNGNCYEYGYALAAGKPQVWRWFVNPASKGESSEYAVVRDEAAKKTYYEIRVPKDDIAPAKLEANYKLGWSIIVNDSDTCDCQGGWVGFASRAIVFGKRAEPLADLILSPQRVPVSPKGMLVMIWAEVKSRALGR
ncbi:hypothetical protein DRP77_03480 [Candidatus Poribacteria bacterium]|nr:MAG: hypothetical protein DRP77_03480 [Candidatus Poribacteria bacterium]